MSLSRPLEEIVHGTPVRDPYRWLEDRNLDETEDWIRTQQRLCQSYFASSPEFDVLERRVREYLDVEDVDQPACLQSHYFYRKRAMGQEQGCICVRKVSGGQERILVDPSKESKYTSVGIHRVSADGRHLAYDVRLGGQDRQEIRLVEVGSGLILPTGIPLGYARGFAFSGRGYFYCHETSQTADEHRIRYETFGLPQENKVVFQVPRTRDSRLVLIANSQRLGALWSRSEGLDVLMDFWVADCIDGTTEWTEVFHGRIAPYSPMLCHDRILVLTEAKSGSSKLIELSRDGEELRDFVPEKRTPIQQVAITRDRIFVSYLERGVPTVDAWLLNGQRADSVHLPLGGTTRLLPVQSQEADHFFYSYESFDVPPTIYQHYAETNTTVRWHQRGPTHVNNQHIVRETTYRSKDGSQIPLTLVSANHAAPGISPRPVIMTSYGGFGVTLTPQFSVLAAILMEMGAVFALPHIRGGGEFGKAWHEAGRARNRQATFDDFIAAAEWLCDQGVSNPRQLAIFGGSNSGLLVASAMTQRPDLFGAVLCIAPLLDMIRYEAFDRAARWRREYGTVENQQDFQVLLAYSPYHRVAEDVNYPATLFVSGDKDDRCNPAHVRKMAARLQERPAQKAPVLVDYSPERGHSPALPLSDRVQALARRLMFLTRELEIPVRIGGSLEATHS